MSSSRLAWATLGQLGGIGSFERLARRLGLRRLSGRPLTRGVWTGERRGRPLTLRASRESAPSLAWRAELGGFGTKLPAFSREADSSRGSGLEPAAAAVPPALLAALKPGERIAGGPDGLRCSGQRPPSVTHLASLLDALEAFAAELNTFALPELLAQRWASQSDAPSRARLARACLAAFPDSETAAHLREEAIADHDWSVRLVARTAGLPPRQAIEGAWTVAVCPEAPTVVRQDAVDRLVPNSALEPAERLQALGHLRVALTFSEPSLRATALRTAARLGRLAFGLLADGIEDASAAVRVAGLHALGTLGDHLSEQAVLHILTTPALAAGREVTVTALKVLGESGSVRAVPVLDATLGDLGMGDPRSEEVLGALRRILVRHPVTGPRGALAVAAETGQLSES